LFGVLFLGWSCAIDCLVGWLIGLNWWNKFFFLAKSQDCYKNCIMLLKEHRRGISIIRDMDAFMGLQHFGLKLICKKKK